MFRYIMSELSLNYIELMMTPSRCPVIHQVIAAYGDGDALAANGGTSVKASPVTKQCRGLLQRPQQAADVLSAVEADGDPAEVAIVRLQLAMVGFPCSLAPAKFEALRHDMGRSIEWAQAELKRRRVVELSLGELAELRRDMAESSSWMRAELATRKSEKYERGIFHGIGLPGTS